VSLNFVNCGHHILTLGKDNAMRLWISANGLNSLINYGNIIVGKTATCMQISCSETYDKNYAFIPNNYNLSVYDVNNGVQKHALRGHYDSINCCKYNPSLNEIYTGSKDKNILIWNYEIDEPKEVFNRFSHSFLSGVSHNKKTTDNISTLNNRSNENISTTNISSDRIASQRDNWSDDDE
jgi:WD40 repeat protein